MSATIVRIVGPSYCGSTVLGCALNTGPGFFFGSEIYRYRHSWRQQNAEGRFARCDFCGADCDYWSTDLQRWLDAHAVDSLPDIYDELLRRHPEISVLVDGSKSVPDPAERPPDTVIVPTKHPLRLIASHVYNRRARLGLVSNEIDDVAAELESDRSSLLPSISAVAKRFRQQYTSIFAGCPDAHAFRADEAHLDGFEAFRELERAMELPPATFDPAHFSDHPSHTIGGNRAPIWMTKSRSGQDTPQNARTRYYDETDGVGDWKVDDKFRRLFRPSIIESIASDADYLALCDLLAYSPAVPDDVGPERTEAGSGDGSGGRAHG